VLGKEELNHFQTEGKGESPPKWLEKNISFLECYQDPPARPSGKNSTRMIAYGIRKRHNCDRESVELLCVITIERSV